MKVYSQLCIRFWKYFKFSSGSENNKSLKEHIQVIF